MKINVTLEPGDRERLVHLMEGWVNVIEDPDEPLIGMAGSPEPLSPRELVQHVRQETDIGERYIQNLADVAAKTAFRDVAQQTFSQSPAASSSAQRGTSR